MADYIAKLGMKVETDGAAKAASDLDKVSASSQKATTAANKFKAQATSTGAATSQLGYKASQAGYQVSDLAVQLEMGTPFMRAFGQQASQLLAVFGPAGIMAGTVIAVGSAIGGVLVNSLKSATVEVERFELSLEDLRKKADELRMHQVEWAIEQTQDQINAMREMGSQTVVTAARIETLEGNLKRFPGNAKAEEWRKELSRLKAETEGTEDQTKKLTDQLAALQTRLAQLKGEVSEPAEKIAAALPKLMAGEAERLKAITERMSANAIAAQAEKKALEEITQKALEQDNWQLLNRENFYNRLAEMRNANAEQENIISLQNSKVWNDSREARAKKEEAMSKKTGEAIVSATQLVSIQNSKAWVESMKHRAEQEKAISVRSAADELKRAQILADQKATIITSLSSIGQALMAASSKKEFELGKQVATATALINTYQGATKAFAQGGILGFATAAAVTAAGMMQVRAIQNTQFGGGAASAAPISAPSLPSSASPNQVQQVSINITGGQFGAGAGDDIISKLKDFFSRDGVLFDGASTQGQVLANG